MAGTSSSSSFSSSAAHAQEAERDSSTAEGAVSRRKYDHEPGGDAACVSQKEGQEEAPLELDHRQHLYQRDKAKKKLTPEGVRKEEKAHARAAAKAAEAPAAKSWHKAAEAQVAKSLAQALAFAKAEAKAKAEAQAAKSLAQALAVAKAEAKAKARAAAKAAALAAEAWALEQQTRNIAAQVTLTLHRQGMLAKCICSLLHCGSARWQAISQGWLKRVRTFMSDGMPVGDFACVDIEGNDLHEPYAVSVSAVGGLTRTWALNPFPEGDAATLL